MADGDFDVLHPGLMYRLFNEYWFGHRALDLVRRELDGLGAGRSLRRDDELLRDPRALHHLPPFRDLRSEISAELRR